MSCDGSGDWAVVKNQETIVGNNRAKPRERQSETQSTSSYEWRGGRRDHAMLQRP